MNHDLLLKPLLTFTDTGIGRVVKQLTKAGDKEVAKAARIVKTRWQNILERRVELKLKDKPEVQRLFFRYYVYSF